jgi:hypothetical protein
MEKDEESPNLQGAVGPKSLRRHYPDQVQSKNSWVSSQPAVYASTPFKVQSYNLFGICCAFLIRNSF